MRILYFWISSSILIGLVLGIRRVFRKQISPGMLYALWLIPMIRLLIPFSFVELPVFGNAAEIFSIPYQILLDNVSSDKTNVNPAIGGTDINWELLNGEGTKTADMTVIAGLPEQKSGSDMAKPDATGSRDSAQAYEEHGKHWKNSMTAKALFCIWLFGSFSVGLYAILSNFHLLRSVSFMEETKGDCPLPVYCSDAVVSPCLFGLLHPSILVNHMVEEDEELYQNVLCHELSHYRQKDHIWTFVRILLCVVYWWNPLVWIGASCAGEDAELACDARVIKGMSVEERKSYGYSLLRLLTYAEGGRQSLCIATSLSGGKKSIKRRMEGIAGNVPTKKYVIFPLFLVLTVLMLYGCSVPSTKSWMRTDWDMDEAVPEQMQADYEFALQEDIKSRLFYYEIYHYGELSELGMFTYGDFEKQNGSFGITLEETQDEETQDEETQDEETQEKAYHVTMEQNGVSYNMPLPVQKISEAARGGSILWAEGKKQRVQAGDDLVLMAQFIQPVYTEGTVTSAYTCENLTEMTAKEKAETLKDTYLTVLIHMVLSDLPGDQLLEQQLENLSKRSSEAGVGTSNSQDFIEAWAEAFTGRAGKELIDMMSEELKQQMIEENWLMLEEEDDFVYFGWSSPWPGMFTDKGYKILRSGSDKAEILYYAGDSTPHLYVWKETLEYVKKDGSYQMISESVEDLSVISSAEEFYRAYPDGEITGTEMDYQKNGLGEYLNQHALEGLNDTIYARLFDAELAALDLLNISAMDNGEWQDISDRVTTSVEDRSGVTTVQITFLQDNSMVEVSMIQPYGEDGIWIPAGIN